MFTGIVQSLGTIESMQGYGGDSRLRITAPDLPVAEMGIGESVAVNGVCLTAVSYTDRGFEADVSGETLSRTSLGDLARGSAVNLERALLPQTPLGGHLVSGHVDGLGELVLREPAGRSERFRFRVPGRLARYVAEKGSICIDGVSLTVNGVDGAEFEVNLVPHTLEVTTLGGLRAGMKVNIEVDIIARYLERLAFGGEADGADTGITRGMLQRFGFDRGQ
ncbi:riboflavin synthase [Ectothiorhodospiraceae bacterium WFHF3C12]|nr:riboflavin synthase [Ectothiorhodospiraceae bacterium WFHF3C12]